MSYDAQVKNMLFDKIEYAFFGDEAKSVETFKNTIVVQFKSGRSFTFRFEITESKKPNSNKDDLEETTIS